MAYEINIMGQKDNAVLNRIIHSNQAQYMVKLSGAVSFNQKVLSFLYQPSNNRLISSHGIA